MKKRVLFILLLSLVLCFAFSMAISAAYYVDHDGNLVDGTSENIAYEFDVGGNRELDGNKCFRIAAVYLHDTTITKIIFPVASQVKSGYSGIAPQGGWSTSLQVYGINSDGSRNTDVSYATQIEEVEFLSGVDFDGAYSSGAFSGFTGLKKLIFHGNVSCGNDATNKGGYFKNTQISTIDFHGSGKVNLAILRHLNSKSSLTVTFYDDCDATVYLRRGGYYCLPSASLTDWTMIINSKVEFDNLATDSEVLALTGSGTPNINLIMAVDSKSTASDDAKTSHGIMYSGANTEVITATLKAWCELGYGTHNNVVTFSQGDNLLLDAITKVTGCDKCLTGKTEELSPAFVSLGYSVNTNGSFMQGFAVNRKVIEQLKVEAGYEISFGLVAANKDQLTGTSLITSDGQTNKEIGDNIISVEYTNSNFDMFEMKLSGFISEKYMGVNLYCCAYYILNGDVYYMSNNVANRDVSDMSVTYASIIENTKE